MEVRREDDLGVALLAVIKNGNHKTNLENGICFVPLPPVVHDRCAHRMYVGVYAVVRVDGLDAVGLGFVEPHGAAGDVLRRVQAHVDG